MSDAQLTAQGTRYYWCERCKKAVSPHDIATLPDPDKGRTGSHGLDPFLHITCGPVVVK